MSARSWRGGTCNRRVRLIRREEKGENVLIGKQPRILGSVRGRSGESEAQDEEALPSDNLHEGLHNRLLQPWDQSRLPCRHFPGRKGHQKTTPPTLWRWMIEYIYDHIKKVPRRRRPLWNPPEAKGARIPRNEILLAISWTCFQSRGLFSCVLSDQPRTEG